MTFRRATLRLNAIASDRVASEAPDNAWNEARGVLLVDGVTRNGPGFFKIKGDLTAQVMAAGFIRSGGNNYLLLVHRGRDGAPTFAVNDEVRLTVWDTGNDTTHDVTPSGWSSLAAPADTTTASVANFGGLAVVNVSDRDPVYWDGDTATDATALPDWPTNGRCRAIRAHRGFLFAVGFFSDNEHRVRWSDAAEPGTMPAHWTPGAGNLAGFVDLMPSSSPAIDAAEIGNQLALFKREGMYLADFIGGDLVFSVRPAQPQVGLMAVGGILQGPGGQLLFVGSDGDLFVTNGAEVTSAIGGRVRDDFRASLGNPPLLFMADWPERGCALIQSSDERFGAAFTWSTGATTLYDAGFTRGPFAVLIGNSAARIAWADAAGSWQTQGQPWGYVEPARGVDQLVAYDGINRLKVTTGRIDGVSFRGETYALKAALDFEAPSRRKLVSRVTPILEADAEFAGTLRVGAAEEANGPIRFGDTAEIDATTGDVPVSVEGRYIAVQFAATAGSWKLHGFDFDFRFTGRH